MKGVDTNVLLRYILRDDPRQASEAGRVLEEAEARDERLFVSTPVLCELCWTLRDASYGVAKAKLTEILELLLSMPLFEIQERDAVAAAIRRFAHGGRADFPDYLIGELGHRAGCASTLTFDRRLRSEAQFELLQA